MRLFYLINGWAGRTEWLDNSLRFFYVGITPLLATALVALIFLWPQRADGSTPFSRRRMFWSLALSLALGVFVVITINAFQMQVLGGAPMTSRPFMTHWATVLVVEPNNSAFPCFEVMFAAGAATLIWAISPASGLAAWLLVLGLGFARIYCGSDYLADSVAGAALGGALSTLALALCHVHLCWPRLRACDSSKALRWRLRHQGMLSGATLLVLFASGFYWLLSTPSQGTKMRAWFASALGQNAVAAATADSQGAMTTASLHDNIREGEGAPPESAANTPGQMLLDSRAARLDGHLPDAEKYLGQVLNNLHAPYPILGINVAQVVAGTTAYRVAAIRIEIKTSENKSRSTSERARVAQIAATLIRRAFQSDAQLQHVDLIGLQADAPPLFTPSEFYPAPKWSPVFTASIERRDLIIRQPGKPKWVNDPHLDGGLWLRARSLLYIDPRALPAAEAATRSTLKISPKKLAPQTIASKAKIKSKPAAQVLKPLVAKGALSSSRVGAPPVKRSGAQLLHPARRRFRHYRRHRHYRYRRHH